MITFYSWILLGKHFFKQALNARRLLGFTALALAPAAVALALRFLIPEARTGLGQHLEHNLRWVFLANLHVQAVTLWICLCLSPAIAREEAEEGGMEYVLIRPVPRGRIFLARYGACVAASILILLAGLAALYAASYGGTNEGIGAQREMLGRLAFTQGLACAMYCAMGTLLSLITTRPITWGMAYLFFGEMMTAGIKALIGKFTLAYYLRSLLSQYAFPPIDQLYTIAMVLPVPRRFDAAGLVHAVAVLTIATGVALAFSLHQFQRREWAKPPQEA